jgi:gamma-glutamyltranspeptidase/glutathione hydrolase
MLNMLSGDDYGALGWGSAAAVHLLTETMRRAFADRAEYLGDPEFTTVPLRGLVAPAYATALRKTIDPAKATPSAVVKPGSPAAHESPSTTHLSVVDRWGNAVSTTQTVNYTFGSCVVAEGTGVVLNDEMDDFSIKPGVPNAYGLVGSAANAVAAKKTMLSSMSPTMVFAPDGRLELVVGSPGGPRIISATLQTIINVIDFKMPLVDAVHAPRIHHQWLPDEMRAEKGALTPDVLAKLTAMGHKIAEKGSIGDVQAVGVEPDGGLIGVSDTRSEGSPRGY